MRRFFGLAPKSSTERSAALEQVTVAPTPQVHARGVRNGPDDAPPVPPKHSDPRAGAERASSDGHDDEDEIVLSSRRSRHVNFVASPAPSLPHPLQHQPSIESSHGGPLACFPRTSNASTLAPSSSARSPTSSGSSDQIHRPVPPGPPQSSTSHSASTSYLSHSQARTGSSLSRVASSVGTSPYGLNSYPSLSKLAHDGGGRDTVITSPTTWSEMVSEDLVDNLSDRERTRQEVLFEVVASEERRVLSSLRSCPAHPAADTSWSCARSFILTSSRFFTPPSLQRRTPTRPPSRSPRRRHRARRTRGRSCLSPPSSSVRSTPTSTSGPCRRAGAGAAKYPTWTGAATATSGSVRSRRATLPHMAAHDSRSRFSLGPTSRISRIWTTRRAHPFRLEANSLRSPSGSVIPSDVPYRRPSSTRRCHPRSSSLQYYLKVSETR